MAIIGSIRKRGTLIVVIVGLSLAAFILGGAQSLFVSNDTSVGSFNGTKVSIDKYSRMVEEKKAFVLTINPGSEIDEATEDALKQEVWDDLLRDNVYKKQYDILGLNLSEAEINDMFVGETVDPSIRQQFVNQAGQFDPNLVQQYSQQFEDNSTIPEDKQQEWLARRTYWGYLQTKLKHDRLQNKYMNMVQKGLYVTTKEATSLYKANSDHANIRFVVKSYATIPDSTVSFTEEELVNFFKEHKYRMRSKKSKAIKYAVFLSIPTKGDSLALRTNMDTLRVELERSDDDTMFVAQNSEETTPPQWIKKGILTPLLDSLLFNAPKGTVAGPVIESGYLIIAKKGIERFQPDSTKARHILIQPTENSEAAVKKAMELRDSLYKVLQSDMSKFAAFAAQFSKDGSAKDSGNLGWFGKGQMVAEFNDSAFAGKKGDLKIVNSQFGFHIVYIIDQTAPVKESLISMVVKAIKPSDETKKVQYNMANEMAYPDKKASGFDALKHMETFAKKNNIIYRDEPSIAEATRNILNMENTKPIVKWALGKKRGEISDIFESGDNYIVAVVSADRPDGIPALNDVRDDVITAFRKHKKAEQFINEFNAELGKSKDINALAGAMKLNVGSAQDIAFGSYFVPGAGIEPELLGTAFGIKAGILSKPIEGNSGVFVLVVDQFAPAPGMPDYSMIKKDLIKQTANRATEALTAVREKANVKDYRYKFDIF
jgi:peptidyl-prolyl cis-trans isomerase D